MNFTDYNIILQLYRLGHFWNPDNKDGWNVKESDLVKLNLKDKIVKDALLSYQDIMSLATDGTEPEDLMKIPRCGHPDYQNPHQLGAIGSGSWPEPCQKAGIKIHINKSRMPSVLAAKWPEIQRLTFAAYHKIGANLIETSNEADAHIRVWWEVLFGSTIGMAQFNSQSCSGKVWCKLDPGYTGLMFELFTHELGHNMNLQHTSGGIMNPSVIEVNPKDWNKSDPSYNTLVRYFGGEPVNPLPSPDAILPDNVDFSLPNGIKLNLNFKDYVLKVLYPSTRTKNFILIDNDII